MPLVTQRHHPFDGVFLQPAMIPIPNNKVTNTNTFFILPASSILVLVIKLFINSLLITTVCYKAYKLFTLLIDFQYFSPTDSWRLVHSNSRHIWYTIRFI